MRDFAKMTNLDVWYAHADLDQLRAEFNSQLEKRQRKMVDQGMAKARTRDSMQEVAKLTHLVDGRPRIIADPPLIVPIADLLPKQMDQETFEAQIKDLLATYRRTLETDRRYLLEQYEFADMARKVVGVGSVGTRCWIVLDARPRRPPIRCSCRSRRQTSRSSAVSSAPASTPTWASGWSPGSG